MSPSQYLADPRVRPRSKRAMEELLLTEDELRAKDADEEADLRSVAEDQVAESRARHAEIRRLADAALADLQAVEATLAEMAKVPVKPA